MLRLARNLFCAALVLSAGSLYAESQVNVVFRPGTSAAEKERALVRVGAAKVRNLASFNAATVVVSGDAAANALKNNPAVSLVEEDYAVSAVNPSAKAKPSSGSAQSVSEIPTGVDRIDAEPAIANNEGAGVIVAIVDTGICLTHPDLSANIIGGYNAITPANTPNDDNGHGSHVAGIVAAVFNGVGVVGVADQARLEPVKVLDASGSGSSSSVAAGIDWAATTGHAQIINMSLGSSQSSSLIQSAVQRAAAAGVQISCAAGNSGWARGRNNRSTVIYPARYPECIAVSAWVDTDGKPGGLGSSTGYGADDTLATFSSTGPEVDICAPGTNIYSCWKDNGYATASGTSMASPHVAGILARIVSAGYGSSTTPTARNLMYSLAEPLGSNWTTDQVGHGLVHKAP